MSATRHARLAPDTLETEAPVCPFGRCQPGTDADPIASGWDFEYGTTREEFDIVRCRSCTLVHLRRLPVPNAMPIIYPSNYYAFSDSSSENRLVTLVRDRIETAKCRIYTTLIPSGTADVLDVGCGDGRLLRILRRHCPPGWRFSGVELAERAAGRARDAGFEVITGDFEYLDLRDWEGVFDLILMHQMLEHTRYPHRTLEKARRLLRPGGILSVETPDVQAWDFALFRRRHWGGYHIPRHFFLFDKSTLRALAEATGYRIVSCRSILSPVFWIHSVHNFCIDHRGWRHLAPLIQAQNVILLTAATMIELIQTRLFGRSSNMQMLLRRAD